MPTHASRTITEPARQTPVLAETDVLVCGGGPAGVGAAIAAARNGARTLVLECYGCLGGCATSGMLNRLGPYHDQEKMILGGIPFEILERLVGLGAAIMPKPGPGGGKVPDADNFNYWAPYDPEVLKIILDEMAVGAGVKILFDTRAVGAMVEGGAVRGMFIESKSGRGAILAKVVIDTTGDGDIAAWAGAPHEKGRPEDGLAQPIGLFSKVHNLERDVALRALEAEGDKIRQLAQEQGVRRWGAGSDNLLRRDETYYNADHVHGTDATDIEARSLAWLDARRQVWQSFRFAKKSIPGYERAHIGATAAMLGVRESRRILGEYVLTADDVVESRKFPDAVARYACYIDVHKVGEKKANSYNRRTPKPGTSYDIPYRCLVPKHVENLLVAGRCFSATHEALASARMIPSCMAMGQAAGTAAALAVARNIKPRELDTKLLQGTLRQQGVMI